MVDAVNKRNEFVIKSILYFLLLSMLSLVSTSAGAVVMATGEKGGLYHQFAQQLNLKLESQKQQPLELQNSKGTSENLQLVSQGKVDFAIIQAGTVQLQNIDVITPLFVEPVMVLAKHRTNIKDIGELNGKVVNLGAPGSGSRITGERILQHYEIQSYQLDESYIYAGGEPGYDVSIVVGGLLNEDIKQVIRTDGVRILPIEAASAIALKHTHLHPFVIPRGIFSENPAIPAVNTQSLASTAILVARKGLDNETVNKVLKAIYGSDLRIHFPLLMTPDEVKQWSLFPWTPKSLNYLDPYRGIGVFANFAESIAAIKEIVFALIAAAYFSWVGVRRLQAKKAEALYSEFKEKLDVFLDESVRIEKLCITADRAELEKLLDEAIDLKLKALTELTHERLRGDNLFAIFLSQCNGLIRRIEGKLL